MNNTTNQKTREITTGLSGQGHTIWHVVTEWVSATTGQKMTHFETFDTKAEANAWLKWA